MGERVRLVIDGVDGRVHHVEMDARAEEVGRGMIVVAGSAPPGPRAADRNIVDIAGQGGVYRPSEHLERARTAIDRIGGGTRLLVDVRLPALGRLLDRFAARLLDLGERGGDFCPIGCSSRATAARATSCASRACLSETRFGPSPHSPIEWVRRLPSSRSSYRQSLDPFGRTRI
jgi:hypothetical protein